MTEAHAAAETGFESHEAYEATPEGYRHTTTAFDSRVSILTEDDEAVAQRWDLTPAQEQAVETAGLDEAWRWMCALADWRRAEGHLAARRAAQARTWFEDEVRRTLHHELGHYLGFDHAGLRRPVGGRRVVRDAPASAL